MFGEEKGPRKGKRHSILAQKKENSQVPPIAEENERGNKRNDLKDIKIWAGGAQGDILFRAQRLWNFLSKRFLHSVSPLYSLMINARSAKILTGATRI